MGLISRLRRDRVLRLADRAGSHFARFEQTGQAADLDAAAELGRQAVDLTAPGDPSRGLRLSNLGNALRLRAAVRGNRADLDTAVDAVRQAAELTPGGDPGLPGYLLNFALALTARFELGGDRADLDAAVRASQQAADLFPPGHPDRPLGLSSLARVLLARFQRTSEAADLDTAVRCSRQAVAAAPPGYPDTARYLCDLAEARIIRFERARDDRDLDAALGCWQRACAEPAGLPEEQLAHWNGLAASAASCAITDDRPGLAVELLEQGRSVQWTQALALRGDLAQLTPEDSALAGRLDAVRAGLDTPLLADSPRAADRRMALAREWDDLVEQVRGRAGWEDFLRAPKLDRLLPAAAAGPVVIVNVSPWRCDALIVTTAGVAVKHLAGLTSEEITARAQGYLDALGQVAGAGAADAEEALRDVTGWLWDQIAGPVLAELGSSGPPGPGEPWPRLWWCPTGALSLLPLHAAGHYPAAGMARHESVLDHVVSSYTPTLRALLDARTAGARSAAAPGGRMLAVGLAETPGQAPLPNVARELRLLRERFPGRCTVLDGPDATRDAVRKQLPRHDWVHFSGHADQDLTDPSRGGLLLYDQRFTVAEIGTGQYRGDFAFLSACHTATGGVSLPDEAITLAAALHYAGYRHVIGTLWSVHDRTAADVATTVYAALTTAGTFEPDRAAAALHHAVRDLRAAGKPLGRWTPFTHTGP